MAMIPIKRSERPVPPIMQVTAANHASAELQHTEALIRQALRKITTIATLPQVVAHIIQVVEDPCSTARQLKDIISNDPALATRVLKVANSAFYGLPGHVNSIDRAVVILGFSEVKNIAVASTLNTLFDGTTLGGPFTARDLWRHCVAVAVAASELAKQARRPPAEAFLAGLLHDLGLLIHLQVHPQKLEAVCRTVYDQLAQGAQAVNFCAVERKLIGVGHEELGQALAKHWHLPETLQQAIAFHHHPKSELRGSREMIALVYVADTLVCHGPGFNLTACTQHLDPAEMQHAGLDEPKVYAVNDVLPALIDEAAAIFD